MRLPLIPLFALATGAAFAQEAASWTLRPELVVASVQNAGDLVFAESSGAGSGTGSISSTTAWGRLYGAGAVLATPEWHGVSAVMGTHLARFVAHTQVDRAGSGSVDLDLTGYVMDCAPGLQWRPFQRHLFGCQARFAYIPVGDQDVDWDGSSKGSGSYLAIHPHWGVSYAYRILDRVEVGLEIDLVEPGLYRDREIRAGTRSYAPGSDGGGRELRLRAGWPIGI